MTDLQSLRDELDIQRVIHDYAWACDNGDWALLKSVFTDDAHLDYSSTEGPRRIPRRGRRLARAGPQPAG